MFKSLMIVDTNLSLGGIGITKQRLSLESPLQQLISSGRKQEYKKATFKKGNICVDTFDFLWAEARI